MSKTRLAVLKDFGGLIAGKTLDGILKEGHVYQVDEIMGVLMIKDLGEHAEMSPKPIKFVSAIMNGAHCFTKEEYKKIRGKEKESGVFDNYLEE